MTFLAGPVPTPLPAAEVLRQNGRSFHFAKLFLNRQQAKHAAQLYAFCRYVDDLADECVDPLLAEGMLLQLRQEILGDQSPGPEARDMLDLIAQTEMDPNATIDLIDTVRTDLDVVALKTPDDLIRYAYGVAGTVGLMMCGVLGAHDPKARHFAVDLGIAMQLTNIARDVWEDAWLGRRYLPGDWIGDMAKDALRAPTEPQKQKIAAAVRNLLALAEVYYESAFDGFGLLPLRSRLAIFIAARVYRQIGIKLRRKGCSVWRGRTVVATHEKIVVAMRAIVAFATTPGLHIQLRTHDDRLHNPLRDVATLQRNL